MKEIEEDTNRWEDKPLSWTGRINIIKMTIISKEVHSFSTIPIKLAKVFGFLLFLVITSDVCKSIIKGASSFFIVGSVNKNNKFSHLCKES